MRLNQTICNILNCVIYQNPFSWDKFVSLCAFAYNFSIQESIGQTPAFVLFGREYTLPIDLINPIEDLKQKSEILSSEYVRNLQSTIQTAHHSARSTMQKAFIKQERFYNNRVKENESKRVSLVYYYYPIKNNKVGKECYYQR